ncbi:MAG TPA: hypothetical protein PKA81_04830 [Clostridia bacterium]|nr:hypothetical protein [Clostridia bacterium]
MNIQSQIRTVCGDILPETLGYCQCHEHIFLRAGTTPALSPAICFEDLSRSAQELQLYKCCGGNAIVDAQPIGCGRDARALLALSAQTKVHIIASTGFHRLAFYAPTHWIFKLDTERLASLFEHEITQGMFESCDNAPPSSLPLCCRAGQIKTALEPEGITGQRRTLLLAAAQASVRTGAPLMVHVERGSDPVALLNFWEATGVSPQKMIFCHMDRMVDSLAIHQELCRKGAYLEYDTIGRLKYHTDEREAEIIEQIASSGYLSQLLLSLDTTRARLKSYGGDIGICYLIESFSPFLKARGFSEQSLQQLQQQNPATVYAFACN